MRDDRVVHTALLGPHGPALLTGLAAGLAVAMPLGAIGILLLHHAMTYGLRSAIAGAAGVAAVDAAYATVAVLAGTWVSAALAGYETPVRLGGAIALGTVAAWGIARTFARSAPPRGPEPRPSPSDRRPAATFARFVALTAVNPLTAGAFAVLAAGFADRWPTAGDRVAFVVGVTVASLGWQLLLAVTGGLVGARAGERARRVLGGIGFGMVGVLAVVLAAG